MRETKTCAVLGHHPMRFAWGFDEESNGYQMLKLELAQQIAALRQQGVARFAVVADYGVGLYAGEIINIMREKDPDLELLVVTPHEEYATKWTPQLRERYFDLIINNSSLEPISLHKTAICEYQAYQHIINKADFILAVYDSTTSRGDVIDMAMAYAEQQRRDALLIHPDTMEVKWYELEL